MDALRSAIRRSIVGAMACPRPLTLCMFKESKAMQVSVALFGAARVVTGQPRVEVAFDAPSITLGQVLQRISGDYPRVRPYLLDETGMLLSYMRVLINN